MVVLYAMGKKFTQQQFETLSETIRSKSQSPEDAEEQIQYLREWDDPVFWAERHFYDPDTGDKPLAIKTSFKPFLRDGSRNRAVRVGRQCVLEGTLIHTRDGQIGPIEHHPDAWCTNENADIVEIRAWGGYHLRCTPDHQVKTETGWVAAGSLKSGDRLQVMTKWDKWGNDEVEYEYELGTPYRDSVTYKGTYHVTPYHAELLGWITADGSGIKTEKGKWQSVKFTNVTPEYIDRVMFLTARLFPEITPKLYAKGNGYDVILSWGSKTQGNPIRHFMRSMQFEDGFPTAVARYFSKACVEAFFRGMYPADGYVHYKYGKNKSQKYECGLACGNSWFFAQHVRELLNKLGIRAGIKHESMKGCTPGKRFHRVVFSGSDNAEVFLSTIGDIQGKKLPKVSTSQRKPSKIKHQIVEPDGEVTHYADILSVKPFGTGPVWDMVVPHKHWYMTGGIMSHNCGKTVHSAVDILHTAYFEKNSVILVMVTQKKLMNRMLEIMSNYLRKSDIKSTFKMKGGKKAGTGDVEPTYDYEITVGDGFSHIRFFFLGNNPDKVRGQRATHIYIDEADYYPDAAWPVITGIIKGRPDIKLTSTSTPCGIDGTWFFNFC